MHRAGRGRQRQRRNSPGEGSILHIGRQAQHNRLAVAQRARHGPQHILARGSGRVDALRDGPDGTDHLGLLDVEVRLHCTRRHVSRQHQQRCPALRGLADAGQCIGEARPRMHADQGQLASRFGVGVAHASRVAFVSRGDELDPGLHQCVRDLEIGGPEQAKAAARSINDQVVGEDGSNSWTTFHPRPALFRSAVCDQQPLSDEQIGKPGGDHREQQQQRQQQ
jgi:hypothetical protein